MTYQNSTNYFNNFTAHRLSSDRKSPCDLIRDKERKARLAKIDQFRADLRVHLKSDLIKSYTPRSN